MTISQLITKRDLEHDANFLLDALEDHVMHLAPLPVDFTDDDGWNKFFIRVQIVLDIERIRREVMK